MIVANIIEVSFFYFYFDELRHIDSRFIVLFYCKQLETNYMQITYIKHV